MHFQGYLRTFRDTDPYSATLTRTQLGLGGKLGRPSLPIFENRKKHPIFGEKGRDCVHLRVKFSIQNFASI